MRKPRGGGWRRTQAGRVILVALRPLTEAAALMPVVSGGLGGEAGGRRARLMGVLVALAAVVLTWLGAGIFLQEIWQGIEGLWRRPFMEHGIFFVLAAPVAIGLVALFAGSRRRR